MIDDHGRRRPRGRDLFPIEGAPVQTRKLMGNLLRKRRGAIGFQYRPQFRKATTVHEHLSSDIESGRRDNFPVDQMSFLAKAYEVTLESMVAVAWGEADRLEPADDNAGTARIVPFPSSDVTAQLGPRPAGVSNAAIPEALTILRQLWRLARQPNPIPEDQATGEDLFGPGLNADSWDQLRNVDMLNWQDSIYSLAEVIAREKEMGLRSGSGGG